MEVWCDSHEAAAVVEDILDRARAPYRKKGPFIGTIKWRFEINRDTDEYILEELRNTPDVRLQG